MFVAKVDFRRECVCCVQPQPCSLLPPSITSGVPARGVPSAAYVDSLMKDDVLSGRAEPVVPEGVCARALCAHAFEPLSVAVARLIFRTRIAPGLIVTTLRYVLRAAGLSAELFLDPLVANHLLPPTDHLASLPRLLAALAAHYSTPSDVEGRMVLTDDHVFRLVRAAFLGYNYKSVGYRLGLGRHARFATCPLPIYTAAFTCVYTACTHGWHFTDHGQTRGVRSASVGAAQLVLVGGSARV